MANGDVLVFEIKKNKEGKEIMSIVEDRNKVDAKLTTQEKMIFQKYKEPEEENGEVETLDYPSDVEPEIQYESTGLKNAKTITYKAIYGIAPPPAKKVPQPKIILRGKPVHLGQPVNLKVDFIGKSANPNDFNDAESVASEIGRQTGNMNIKITVTGYVLLGTNKLDDWVIGSSQNGLCNCTFRQLAQQRAEYMKERLILNGVNPAQIQVVVPESGHTEQKTTVTFNK